MPKTEKVRVVDELKQRIQESQVAVMTKFIGINVAQATELRSKLRSQQVSLKVFKNTLAKRALEELGFSAAAAFMQGPTAWAFSKDAMSVTRMLKDFGKDIPMVEMVGGLLEGRVVSKSDLETLATLPSREALLAQVVGTIAAPLRNVLGVLSGVPRNMVSVLDQIRKQKEQAGAAA